jgi:uncharacterized protein (TIGR03382 family)
MLRPLFIAGLTAAALAAAVSPAAAQVCNGDLVEVTEYDGRQNFDVALAAGGGEAVVAWAVDGADGWPATEFTLSRVAADGTAAAIPSDMVGVDSSGRIGPLVSSGATLLQPATTQDVGLVLREPSGALRSRIHLDDYRALGESGVRASFDGAQFVVTWVSGPADASVRKAMRFDRLGAPLDPAPRVLGPAFAYRPWSASARIGGVTWVVWSTFASADAEFVAGTNPDLVGVRLDGDGQVVDPAPVVLVPGARGVALVANGDVGLLLVTTPDGRDQVMTVDRDGGAAPGDALALADEEFVLGLLPAPAGDDFTLWTTRTSFTEAPVEFHGQVDARAISRTGAVAATPIMTLTGQGRGIATDGDTYVLATVDETIAGDAGEERLTLRRFRAGAFTPVTTATTITAAPLALTTTQFCSGPYDEFDGCQASGPAGAGTLALIALGLVALGRRPRRR